MPTEIFNQPQTICSTEAVRAIVDTKICWARNMGEPCLHAGGVHDELADFYLNKKVSDPLGIVPSGHTYAFALYIGRSYRFSGCTY